MLTDKCDRNNKKKDFYWNPWHGCRKASEGCLNCFVYYLDNQHGLDASVIGKSKTGYELPLKEDRSGKYKIPPGSTVATCFTSDFFIEEADEWRPRAWEIIKERADVDFLICTKRIARFEGCLPPDWGDGYDNVSIAVSCENQKRADERLPYLISVKAKEKFIFASPLLEPLSLDRYLASGAIAMVSVGGESYENARECNFEWVKQIKSSCDKYGVIFDFHQTGSNFVFNGKRYKIKHRNEYEQAKKGLAYLDSIQREFLD